MMKTNLGAARKYAGYTQQSAADALGIPVSTLRKWEQGVYEPDIGSIISFAKLYRTTADTILGTQFADSSIVSPGSSPTASSERLEVFHMTIGENIRRIRSSRSMTQEEFGKIADVSSMAVSQWENGRAVPRMNAVEKIANYFGITKGDIIDDALDGFESVFPDESATVHLPISSNIKKHRAESGLTQEQLADKLGVARSTVTQWETGWSQPRMGMIEKLASVFGISASELVSEKSPHCSKSIFPGDADNGNDPDEEIVLVEDAKMEFSESLKRIIRDRDMRQADLCRMAQLDSSLMSMYIRGRRSPTLANAIAIADALQISLDELSGRDVPKRVIERKLLTNFRELSDKGQEVAVNTIIGLRSVYKKRRADGMAASA